MRETKLFQALWNNARYILGPAAGFTPLNKENTLEPALSSIMEDVAGRLSQRRNWQFLISNPTSAFGIFPLYLEQIYLVRKAALNRIMQSRRDRSDRAIWCLWFRIRSWNLRKGKWRKAAQRKAAWFTCIHCNPCMLARAATNEEWLRLVAKLGCKEIGFLQISFKIMIWYHKWSPQTI